MISSWGLEHVNMGVSKNNGTPKSSILIGFSIITHPFWGTTIFGNTHIGNAKCPPVPFFFNWESSGFEV